MKDNVSNSKIQKAPKVQEVNRLLCVITNQLFFPPLFSPLWEMNFQCAMCYIDRVKLAYLPTKPYVFPLFLYIMLLFGNGSYVILAPPPSGLSFSSLQTSFSLINWSNKHYDEICDGEGHCTLWQSRGEGEGSACWGLALSALGVEN